MNKLQNIPLRTERARNLRDAFYTPLFLDADYAALEEEAMKQPTRQALTNMAYGLVSLANMTERKQHRGTPARYQARYCKKRKMRVVWRINV